MRIRTIALCTILPLLAACGGGGEEAATTQDDVLRRTVISLEVAPQGLIEMDLTADPPVMVPGDGDRGRVPVTDLDAARTLRAELLALPPVAGDCAVTVEPRFSARVATYPTAEDAPFADLAVHEVGGPCSDLTDVDIAALVDLWNQAGGSIEFDPAG